MSNQKKCDKCGCMVDTRGFSMHQAFCKGEKKEDTEELIIDSKDSIKKCHECKGVNILRIDEFIKQNNSKKFDKNKLYSSGNTHVCVDCGELLK